MNWILVFIGGGIGSILRYAISLLTLKFGTINFPVATLVSNFIACFVLGIVLYSFSDKLVQFPWLQPFVVIGFCGGFSTFSTFSNETVQLINSGNWHIALLNISISLVTGIGIIFWFQSRVG